MIVNSKILSKGRKDCFIKRRGYIDIQIGFHQILILCNSECNAKMIYWNDYLGTKIIYNRIDLISTYNFLIRLLKGINLY